MTAPPQDPAPRDASDQVAPPRDEAGEIDAVEGEAQKTRPVARGVAVAALVAAIALAGVLWRQGVFERPPVTPPAPTQPVDPLAQRLAAAPDYVPFFDALAARFPADWAQIRESLAVRPDTEGPDRLVAEALKALRATRGVVAAKADAPAMARVFEAQAAMIEGLRAADPKLCVDFVYGGATDAFMAFAATRRPLLAAVALAGLDAILDGGDRKIEREAPTDEDFAALEAALRGKGMGEAEIAALLDGKLPDPPLPDERMCEAAGAYVAAVLALPEPTRSRVMALAIELMARS